MLKKKYYYPTDKYFFITVLPNSPSFGSTVPNGTDKYLKDSSLSISATPNPGYIFSRWSDNDTNASRTVTVIEDKTYTAIFTLPNYTVTYNGNGNTGGSVPIDSHSPYSSGGEVEVLGNTGNLVKTGYTFDGWTMDQGGGGTLYNAGDTFNISGNTILYALWEGIPRTILVQEPFFNLQCTGSGTYANGDSVSIGVSLPYTDSDGRVWTLYRWQDLRTGFDPLWNSNPRTVTVTSDKTYTALVLVSNAFLGEFVVTTGSSTYFIEYKTVDRDGEELTHSMGAHVRAINIKDHTSLMNLNNTIKFKVSSNTPTFTIKDSNENDIPYTFDGEYYVFNWTYYPNNSFTVRLIN